MKKINLLLLPWLVASLLSLLLPASAGATPTTFYDTGFENTWNRVDKPVQDIPGLQRGYTWGPQVADSQVISAEPYNGGARKVEYFDKARMEVTNPTGDPNSLYYVTTGLLVKELVTGNRQDGDNSFTQLAPSQVQVAGDDNSNGVNAVSPVYASFTNIGTFGGVSNPQAKGALISSQIDRGGNVSTFSPPEQRFNSGYDDVTGHNIADVFVDFSNQGGQIWNGSGYSQDALFFNNPTYVLGRPMTEPYWIRAVVAGKEQDVLVQLFERRVLTYTPANSPAYRVEMGNVGQHYYKWRYTLNGCAKDPAPATTTALSITPIASTTKGTIEDGTFFSPTLNRIMPYRIYLPPNYATSNQSYPVAYMLHGYSGDYREWYNLGYLGRADDLMSGNQIKPFIIVLPLGDTGYWMNQANCGPQWGDYVSQDVVSLIDKTYRTLQTPDNRAIGGLSMGAHGALEIGFNNPSVFGIIGAHSPTIRTLAQAPDFFGDAAHYATIDPITLAQTKDLSSFKIWIDIGLQDSLWVAKAEELHQVLVGRNVAHQWHEWPGDHSGDYWYPHLIDYLQFYAGAFKY